MTERVLAVVVSYNPSPGALQVLLKATISQVDELLLVDNASANFDVVSTIVADIDSTDKSIVIDRQDSNLGLGAAHNIGFRYAKAKEFDYVLLLDQDSVPMDDMVKNLVVAHQTKSQTNRVAATGVTYLNADNGSESFFVQFGLLKFKRLHGADRDDDGCVPADFLISSGSLFSLPNFADIGEMDESLFIDHVDTEWFLRAHHQRYKSFGVCDARMQHGLGETTHRIDLSGNIFLRMFGRRAKRQRNVPQHKSFRYYYIFRNSVLLYKRSYCRGLWKWNDLQRLVMIALMFGIVKKPRLENLSMMWRGTLDGLRGVSGPFED